jgi:hypothetical protein
MKGPERIVFLCRPILLKTGVLLAFKHTVYNINGKVQNSPFEQAECYDSEYIYSIYGELVNTES